MPGARFVDPKILARIGNLELLARTVVDGFINGLHRAPYFGASIDFAEHRGYVAGDDIRRVDWRLYARTDRYYVKQYEADTNTNFCADRRHLEVDELRQPGRHQARIRQLSRRVPRVSGAAAARPRRHASRSTTRSSATCRRRPSTSTCCCTRSIARRPSGRGDLDGPLHKMAEHFKRRSIIVLISDFYEEPERDPRAAQAAALPRQRPHRVSRAGSGRDRLRVRGRVELRGSRERRADSRRAGVVPRASTAS